jgi:hypothetical protein
MKSTYLIPALIAALVNATPVHADSGDVAAAQALFDQGKKLMAANKFAEACPKLEESYRLDPALGTVLNLANCYESQGRLASAWSRFIEAQDMAQAGGHTNAQQVARDRAAKLAPRLSHLVIDATAASSVAGLEIKRDGIVIGNAQWGVPIPADAGSHAVTAASPGHVTWESKVELGANAATATVHVPALEAEPVAATAPGPPPMASAAPPTAPGSDAPAPMAADSPKESGLGSQRTWAIVAGGAGVAGVAVGTIFGLMSKARHDDAEAICPGGDCGANQEGVDRWNDARSAGNVSTVAFIIGGAGLAAGAVLWLTAKPANAGAPSAGVSAGPSSLWIMGRW